MTKKLDLEGMNFGRLSVVEAAISCSHGKAKWSCLCLCGSKTEVSSRSLTQGLTKSCGCMRREKAASRASKHGAKGTPVYNVWVSMNARCRNERDRSYVHYGGRGIRVCKSWIESYESFASDMGPRPSNNHSIDRIDNNKGYGPDNCRWATNSQQAGNRRNNNLITFKGRAMILQDWADLIGIEQSTLRYRVANWPLEKALTQPKQGRKS